MEYGTNQNTNGNGIVETVYTYVELATTNTTGITMCMDGNILTCGFYKWW